MSRQRIQALLLDEESPLGNLELSSYRQVGLILQPCSRYLEAQSLIKQGEIDLIIINLDYLQEQSIDLCKKFNLEHRELPIIVTSIQGASPLSQACIALGAQIFLELPLPPKQLITKIKTILKQAVRKHDRALLNRPQLVELETSGQTFLLRLIEISLSGARLRSQQDLPLKRICRLRLRLNNKLIDIKARIVRTNTYPETAETDTAINFLEFYGNSRSNLEVLIDQISPSQPELNYYNGNH